MREGAPQFRRMSVGLGEDAKNHQETPEKMEVVNACPERSEVPGVPPFATQLGRTANWRAKCSARARDACAMPAPPLRHG